MKVGVLALQGDVREHLAALDALGADAVSVRRVDDVSGVDALVLPGGESTTMSLLLQSSGLFAPIADRLRDGMAAFGTCAGMILLAAHVLDGRDDQVSFGAIDIAVRRNAFGRQVDSFETALDVPALGSDAGGNGGSFDAVFIRAPFVESVGDGVEVLAAVDGHPVLCKQGPVLAAAFHPELSAGDLRIHQLFLDHVR